MKRPIGFSCRSDKLDEVGRGSYSNDFQSILLGEVQLNGASSFADFEVNNGDGHGLRHTC